MITITTPKQAIENIKRFNQEVNSFSRKKDDSSLATLVKNIPHYRAWYCLHDETNGSYFFAPSKYIGYSGINANIYSDLNRSGLDGRKTESILSTWYDTIYESNEEYEQLSEELMKFCAKFNKKPNSLFRINIPCNKPSRSTLETDVVEFILNAYQNLSNEGRKQVKNKINKYKADA